jgi:hypothetical protein
MDLAMTISKVIAGLIGPTLIAIAIAMLLNLRFLPALAVQVAREPGLIFLSGILLFVVGLSIVRVHNIWSGGWSVLVTVLGWLAVLSGLVRMFFPTRFSGIAARLGQSTEAIIGGAVVLLVIGAFLSFKAYGRSDGSPEPR